MARFVGQVKDDHRRAVVGMPVDPRLRALRPIITHGFVASVVDGAHRLHHRVYRLRAAWLYGTQDAKIARMRKAMKYEMRGRHADRTTVDQWRHRIRISGEPRIV